MADKNTQCEPSQDKDNTRSSPIGVENGRGPIPAPIGNSVSSTLRRAQFDAGLVSPAEMRKLQETIGNQRVGRLLRRKIADSVLRSDGGGNNASDPATGDDSPLPMGADPVFQDDFDPAPEDDSTQTSGAPNSTDGAVQTLLREASSSVPDVQLQSGGSAAGPAPIVAQSLSWSDFRTVPNRIGGFSAQTGMRRSWRNDGTGFNVRFDPTSSWSLQADQTDALLRHEQFHLNLAVLIANKANAATGSMGARALIRAFNTASTQHDRSYEGDTKHGADARLQGMWESDINAGVPEFPITP